MTDRLAGMRRVLKVQGDLKRMADWRVAEAERGVAEVQDAQRALAAFVDGEVLTGLLAASATLQAKRLDAREAVAGRRVAAEVEDRRDATARQTLVGRMVETLAREERAAAERKDLARLIEGFAARTPVPEE